MLCGRQHLPLGSVPLPVSWREQGRLSLGIDGWKKCRSCSKAGPSLREAPDEKDTVYLGCDSAKHLRLLLEQDKAEECLKGFIIFLRAWQGQTLNY